MPRPLKDRDAPLMRINVLIDTSAIDRAKKKAVNEDVRNIPLVAIPVAFCAGLSIDILRRINERTDSYRML